MRRAGLSDRRRWKGAALSEWQEHYQSIFHRCQPGLVPVSSSGCHLLNEGMKGMFKAEIQACSDKRIMSCFRMRNCHVQSECCRCRQEKFLLKPEDVIEFRTDV